MSIYKKISTVQSKVLVTKDGVNPHFRSKYLTLESIVNVVDPLLRANGLVLTNSSSKEGLLTTTIRDVDTQEEVHSEFPVPMSAKPQEIGSAFTYARRYNLSNLLNIVADRDDDGEATEGRGTTVETKTTEEKSPQVTVSASVVTETPAPKKVSFSKKSFAKPPPTTTVSTGDDL